MFVRSARDTLEPALHHSKLAQGLMASHVDDVVACDGRVGRDQTAVARLLRQKSCGGVLAACLLTLACYYQHP